MRHLFIALLGAALVACTGHEAHTGHGQDGGIVISAARVLPPFPGRDISAGYFEITNHSASNDRLIAASSPVSESVEIHTHKEEGGVMKMRRVDGVELPAGESVLFKPGGYHLMFFKTALAEGQSDVAVTLTYETAPPVTIIVPLEGHDEASGQKGSHGSGSGYEGDKEGHGSGSAYKGDKQNGSQGSGN